MTITHVGTPELQTWFLSDVLTTGQKLSCQLLPAGTGCIAPTGPRPHKTSPSTKPLSTKKCQVAPARLELAQREAHHARPTLHPKVSSSSHSAVLQLRRPLRRPEALDGHARPEGCQRRVVEIQLQVDRRLRIRNPRRRSCRCRSRRIH